VELSTPAQPWLELVALVAAPVEEVDFTAAAFMAAAVALVVVATDAEAV
jgi:hypothetical protein